MMRDATVNKRSTINQLANFEKDTARNTTVFSHPQYKTFLVEQEKYEVETWSWFQANERAWKNQVNFSFIPQL